MWEIEPVEQDERHPYMPVETGDPIGAALAVLAVIGIIFAIAVTLL